MEHIKRDLYVVGYNKLFNYFILIDDIFYFENENSGLLVKITELSGEYVGVEYLGW